MVAFTLQHRLCDMVWPAKRKTYLLFVPLQKKICQLLYNESTDVPNVYLTISL